MNFARVLDERLKKALKGTAALRLANAGLGFAITVLLARLLGAEGLGYYSTAFILASALSVVAVKGISNVVVRETARASAESLAGVHTIWRWSARAGLVTSSITVVLVLAVLFCLDLGESLRTPLLLACLMLPMLAFNSIRAGALRGLGRVLASQIPELLVKPVVFFLTFGLRFS